MFINPSISSELARDRRCELLAQATRQRPIRADRKQASRPGIVTIRIAVAAAVLGVLAAGLTKAVNDVDHGPGRAATTVSMQAAIRKTGGDALTADEHFAVPAIGKRRHQPLVQKVRYSYV